MKPEALHSQPTWIHRDMLSIMLSYFFKSLPIHYHTRKLKKGKVKNEPNLLSLCITFDGRYSKANVGSSILSMFANRRRSSVISSGTEK